MLQEAINNPDGNTRYPVSATVIDVQEVSYNKNTGKPSQLVTLNDGQNECSVKIYPGNKQALTADQIGKRLQFLIGGYVSGYDGKTYLSGFWQRSAQVRQGQPPQSTGRPPAGRPAAKPAVKGTGQPDWDAISRGKVRHGVVCSEIQHNGISGMPAIADIEFWVEYIMTGVLPKKNEASFNETQENEGIPF